MTLQGKYEVASPLFERVLTASFFHHPPNTRRRRDLQPCTGDKAAEEIRCATSVCCFHFESRYDVSLI